jgi:hypothetical protein
MVSRGLRLFTATGAFTGDQFGRSDHVLPGDLYGDGIPDHITSTYLGDSAEGANDDLGTFTILKWR